MWATLRSQSQPQLSSGFLPGWYSSSTEQSSVPYEGLRTLPLHLLLAAGRKRKKKAIRATGPGLRGTGSASYPVPSKDNRCPLRLWMPIGPSVPHHGHLRGPHMSICKPFPRPSYHRMFRSCSACGGSRHPPPHGFALDNELSMSGDPADQPAVRLDIAAEKVIVDSQGRGSPVRIKALDARGASGELASQSIRQVESSVMQGRGLE